MSFSHLLMGLRTVREELGVAASELATRLGITTTTYYRYENGTRRAYWDQVHSIAKYLGVHPHILAELPDVDTLQALAKIRHERMQPPAPVEPPKPIMVLQTNGTYLPLSDEDHLYSHPDHPYTQVIRDRRAAEGLGQPAPAATIAKEPAYVPSQGDLNRWEARYMINPMPEAENEAEEKWRLEKLCAEWDDV